MKRVRIFPLLLLCLAALAVVAAAPFVGLERITPLGVLHGLEGVERDILLKIRVPRVLAAFLAGSALALGGMAFQAMFRNPLATPFTLGVSSGAAFGASLYTFLGGLLPVGGMAGKSVAAFLWALVAILLVYGLTRVRRGFSTATMLVAGVAVNFFFGSLMLLLQYLSDFTQAFSMIRWLMGGFDIVGYAPLYRMLPFNFVGIVLILSLARELDLLSIGDDIAQSRGVDVKRIKGVLFFSTSLMVGSIVSVCGPIGFVGMMVPHMCRLLIGPDHRMLGAFSFLFGGAFLVVCDTLARSIIAPAEIPVGVFTALLGGPFFVWLLLRGSSERGIVESV